MGIYIEDHYYTQTDAAVVFKRVDHWTGSDALSSTMATTAPACPGTIPRSLITCIPEVREAVIQTILHVARKFPMIRFDAAMTLAKKHYQRLWFPEPGSGGAIPSRAEHGMTRAQFDEAFPEEFWREVVDRVAAEVAGHAAAGRSVLADGRLLRAHAGHAPRLQQRLHEYAARRG